MATTFHHEPYSRGEPRLPQVGPRGLLARARLDEHLPVHHRLSRVYRAGAGLVGLFLVVFGVLGVTGNIGFFSTGDNTVLGLNTNGALSWLSILVGLLLLVFGMYGRVSGRLPHDNPYWQARHPREAEEERRRRELSQRAERDSRPPGSPPARGREES